MAVKTAALGIHALIDDYDLIVESGRRRPLKRNTGTRTLTLVQSALRLSVGSSPALAGEDPLELFG
jgi:hypothetical protein